MIIFTHDLLKILNFMIYCLEMIQDAKIFDKNEQDTIIEEYTTTLTEDMDFLELEKYEEFLKTLKVPLK